MMSYQMRVSMNKQFWKGFEKRAGFFGNALQAGKNLLGKGKKLFGQGKKKLQRFNEPIDHQKKLKTIRDLRASALDGRDIARRSEQYNNSALHEGINRRAVQVAQRNKYLGIAESDSKAFKAELKTRQAFRNSPLRGTVKRDADNNWKAARNVGPNGLPNRD